MLFACISSNTKTGKRVEQSIINRIRQGDKQAFSLLVERFQHPLFSYLGKMGLSQAVAEEVAQETFIRAWLAREQFDPNRSAIITWLFTIARRLAINELQRATHRQKYYLEQQLANTKHQKTPEQSGNNEHHVDLSEDARQQRLLQALKTLSADDCSLLSLAYIREFDLSMIGELEGIPVGTVKSRLHRIRQQLKSTLNEGINHE